MSLDLSDTLVVGISATALFDLSEADGLFREATAADRDAGMAEYRKHMLEREGVVLSPGTGFPLVKALLGLNAKRDPKSSALVEVVVLSRNSPETGVRVLNSIREHSLPISRTAFTGGEPVVDYLDAFDVDLFLTTNVEDAQRVADSTQCPVAIVREPPAGSAPLPDDQVRIAFDGDAVLFSEESEVVYQREGLPAFHKAEAAAADIPMSEGPHAAFLRKLGRLQERLPSRVEYSPVRLSIVTARNSPADLRVIKTLRKWNIYIDAVFFLGGLSKAKVLAAFKPHIFLDDQEAHLKDAAKIVPSALVPYPSNSPLRQPLDAVASKPSEAREAIAPASEVLAEQKPG
jgi:5'-nucleotidase